MSRFVFDPGTGLMLPRGAAPRVGKRLCSLFTVGPGFFAGAAAPSAATIWDLTTPTNYTGHTSQFTVSVGGQQMAQTGGSPIALTQKCVVSKTSGLWYLEFKYLSGSGTTVSVGTMSIAAACQNVDAVSGSGGHGDISYRQNGQCFADGSNIFVGGGAGPWVANDIIGVAVAVGASVKMYWNNVLKFTLTVGTYAGLATDPTPMLSWSGGSNGSALLRTLAADLTFTPPAGYTAWE